MSTYSENQAKEPTDDVSKLQFLEGHCSKCGSTKVKKEEIDQNSKHFNCGGRIIVYSCSVED